MVIFGDGSQTRDFTFVADTAHGILLAGLSDKALGETINLGQGKEITVRELADQIRIVTANPNAEIVFDDPRPGDVLRLFADAGKANDLLGFAPKVGLAEGLEKLYEWYASLDQDPTALLQQEVRHNWRVEGTK